MVVKLRVKNDWKMKKKVIFRKENCLETINEKIESYEDIKWMQIDGTVVSSFQLAISNNIL